MIIDMFYKIINIIVYKYKKLREIVREIVREKLREKLRALKKMFLI